MKGVEFTHDGFKLVGHTQLSTVLHKVGTGALMVGGMSTLAGVAAFFQGNMGNSEPLLFVLLLLAWAPLLLVNFFEKRSVPGRTLEVSTGARRVHLGGDSCSLSDLIWTREGATFDTNIGPFSCVDAPHAEELEVALTQLVEASSTPGAVAPPIQQLLAQLGRS